MAQNKKIGLKIRALHTKRMTVGEIAKETHLSEEEIVKYLEERCLKPIYEHESPPCSRMEQGTARNKISSQAPLYR